MANTLTRHEQSTTQLWDNPLFQVSGQVTKEGTTTPTMPAEEKAFEAIGSEPPRTIHGWRWALAGKRN